MRLLPWALASLLTPVCLGATLIPERAEASPPGRSGCARHLRQRSPEQVIRAHVAAIIAGDLDAAMCDFAPNAAVILPGQVITGETNIRAGLSGMAAVLGTGTPTIQTLTVHDDTVLLTFSAYGFPCIIPDGSDTYVVKQGRIVVQTVHDTLYSAPGAVCPLAAPGT